MNTLIRVGGYAIGLVAVSGVTAGIGAAVGPVDPAPAAPASHTAAPGESVVDLTGQTCAAGPSLPAGMQISQNGYTLDLVRELPAGADVPVSFRVSGPDGRPVTAYDTVHDEDLHLIAVRRDFAGYQHVHPQLAADGTWSIPLDLTPGSWRLLADFDPAGADPGLVLGADVSVAGEYTPEVYAEGSPAAQVDGFTVTLAGELVPGQGSELTLTVTRDGKPVTDLQPYLAAYGHLVALRDGDLAYLHVHPGGEPGDGVTAPGPDITFHATAPSAGSYRLFLDFKHHDVVRTAQFTVHARDNTGATPSAETSGADPVVQGADAHDADGHAHN